MRVLQTGLTGLALALLIPSPAAAWHKEGHMLVARVAWQQLTDSERANFTKILKAHPHYDIYLAANRPKDLPEPEWVFVRAATWSDWVRGPAVNGLSQDDADQIRNTYHKSVWHYVDLPYVHPADTGKFNAGEIRKKILEPELDPKGEPRHALAALNQCMKQLKSTDAPDADKAVTLCWLLHLVGDLHQPLHCTTLLASKDTFCPSFDSPQGDRGGNLLAIKVKATDPAAMVLHFYWDALLFSDNPPFEKVDAVSKTLLTKFKRDQLPELAKTDFPAWAEEGLELAKTVVYKGDGCFLRACPLFPDQKVDHKGLVHGLDAPVLPDGYQPAAEAVAARRMVLAGYRLADQLKLVLQPGK